MNEANQQVCRAGRCGSKRMWARCVLGISSVLMLMLGSVVSAAPKVIGGSAVATSSSNVTFLPWLNNADGWASRIHIQNETDQARVIDIYYYTGGGSRPHWNERFELGAGATAELWVDQSNRLPSGYNGTAVVYADGDVAVMVESINRSSNTEVTNYVGAEAGTDIHAPIVKNDFNGRSSSMIVMNVDELAVYVEAVFYTESGQFAKHGAWINPKGHVRIDAAEHCPQLKFCSAVVRTEPSGGTLAGVTMEYQTADGMARATDNMMEGGNRTIYFPLVKHNLSTMISGLQIQNVGSASTTITAKYYLQDGTLKCTRQLEVGPNSSGLFYDFENTCPGTGFLGHVIATTSNSDMAIVGRANETSSDQRVKKAYTSFQRGSPLAVAPLIYGNLTGLGGATWDSPIIVQNTDSAGVDVTVRYMHRNGSPATSVTTKINGYGMAVLFTPVSQFMGSAQIEAMKADGTPGSITALVHVKNDATTGDTHAIYNAIPQ